MAEPQKKNKKKKLPVKMTSVTSSVSTNLAGKDKCVNEMASAKSEMKTVFKEIAVTKLSSKSSISEGSDDKKSIPNGTDPKSTDNTSVKKKKKKKKKSKEQSSESNEISTSNENDNRDHLLNFSENRIELVNHPEISVTLSNLPEVNESECPKSEEKISLSSEQKDPSDANPPSTEPKKKKKKKKKKKSDSLPVSNIDNSEEPVIAAPTYVKLPASGDSCVLVVSHESFSNGNNSLDNSEPDKSKLPQNKVGSIAVQNEKAGEVQKSSDISPINSEIQIGNSVSIFPIAEKIKDETTLEDINNVNKGMNLENITNLMGKEINNVACEPTLPNSLNDTSTEDSKLTKAQLKAERRAKQEAQRAAKLAAKGSDKAPSGAQSAVPDKGMKDSKDLSVAKQNPPQVEKSIIAKNKEKVSAEKELVRKVRLFSHLPQRKPSIAFKELNSTNFKIHPSVLEICAQYSKGIICGSNARCIALLSAFRDVIRDYKTPTGKNFARDLESTLQTYLNFLSNCRPLSVSMINAVKFLKHQINHTPKDMDETKAKEKLCIFINNFVNEEILLAKEAIGNSASAKITDGDVILVFAYSSLVKDVLCKAHSQNKLFRVVVVDSRPKMEGLRMLRCLVKEGLNCCYIAINAISYAMKEVSKVIIGAHSLLSNGCVMSRLGCKQVALVASSYGVPVLVCCETYKFCERVLTDSFVHNELGEPEDLVTMSLEKNESLKNWQQLPSLQILNLMYDVTPSDLISMVITEKGVLPCTSVPVVLRVRHAGLHD